MATKNLTFIFFIYVFIFIPKIVLANNLKTNEVLIVPIGSLYVPIYYLKDEKNVVQVNTFKEFYFIREVNDGYIVRNEENELFYALAKWFVIKSLSYPSKHFIKNKNNVNNIFNLNLYQLINKFEKNLYYSKDTYYSLLFILYLIYGDNFNFEEFLIKFNDFVKNNNKFIIEVIHDFFNSKNENITIYFKQKPTLNFIYSALRVQKPIVLFSNYKNVTGNLIVIYNLVYDKKFYNEKTYYYFENNSIRYCNEEELKQIIDNSANAFLAIL